MSSFIDRRLKRKRRRKLIQVFILVLFLTVVYFSLNKLINHKETNFNPTKPAISNNQQKNNASLETVVQNALQGTNGSYGMAIKNLNTNESYYFNEHKIYTPGSLYKLWVMAVVYKQIQAGTLTEDQTISGDIATLNKKFKIDSDSAELKEGIVNFTVKSALNQMITISHNYAALILTEKVKLSATALFLKDNGFNESTVGTDGSDPTSTPSDIALFFEKLYKGELANAQYTKEMIDLLKTQQLNDKLPKYLPPDTKIAHKTGEIDFATHDAGIVYSPKGDYIIVVLSNSDSPPGAEERIAEVSKAVYDYFLKR